MKEFTDAARPAVLDLLKRHGPLNAPSLADLLNVNHNAVRQQLAVLQREGLVEASVERRQLGRPTHLFSLTEKAEALFPQAYGHLAVSMLRQLVRIDGREKAVQLFAARSKELLQAYKSRLSSLTGERRMKELARIRDEEGYMAECRSSELTEHHCPIAAIAREFPEVCQHEKLLFEKALGMKLTRSEHIATGGKACTYLREK